MTGGHEVTDAPERVGSQFAPFLKRGDQRWVANGQLPEGRGANVMRCHPGSHFLREVGVFGKLDVHTATVG